MPVRKWAKGHNFDSSNILNIESLLPFIFSHIMKEKGIKGRVFDAMILFFTLIIFDGS